MQLKSLGAIILVSGILSGPMAAPVQVEIIQDTTWIYKNAEHRAEEKPIRFARKGERFPLISGGDNIFKLRLQIQINAGKTGWVDKGAVMRAQAVAPKPSPFTMEEAKIIGYLEHPQAVYILDSSDPDFQPILLHRSFKDLLIIDIDRETFQRLYDEKIQPET